MLYQIKIGPPWPPPKNFSRGGPNSARGGPKKIFGALRAPNMINSNLISNLAPPWIFLKIRPCCIVYEIALYKRIEGFRDLKDILSFPNAI